MQKSFYLLIVLLYSVTISWCSKNCELDRSNLYIHGIRKLIGIKPFRFKLNKTSLTIIYFFILTTPGCIAGCLLL